MATSASSRLLRARLRTERRPVAVITALVVAAKLVPLAGPLLLGRFVDQAIESAPVAELTRTAGLYLVMVIIGEALLLVVIWGTIRVAWRVGNQLRHDLAAHAFGQPLAWHGETTPGILIERIDGDTTAVAGFFEQGVVTVIGNAVLLGGVFVVVFVTDIRLGLLLAAVAVTGTSVLVRLRRVAVPAFEAEREAKARLYGELEERLAGIEDLRANGAGPWTLHRFHLRSRDVWHSSRRAAWRGGGGFAVATLTFAIGSIAVLALAVWLERQGTLSVGQVFVLWRYSDLVRDPLVQIAEQMREMQRALAGAERSARLLATPLTLEPGDRELPAGPLALDLDRVTFSYRDGFPALRDVELHLPAGTSLGVVGRTGSGKTTLGRLALRFWDPDEGTIRLGGVDVRDLTGESLRARTGVVTQEVLVMRATVRDNLTLFGALESTDETLVDSLRRVGLGHWFDRLDDGLDSVVAGTGGLSAGEAQLLAFARLLAGDPGFVLLDEATARLDPMSEQRLNRATSDLLTGRTAIVIAHRLETLDRVDQIAVVDDGHIVEWGPASELEQRPGGRYAALVASNRREDVLA